ncbi:MAG: hypothetical protein MUE78_09695 [Ilumatobacteraceae bacterium]|nr:hypothetical protein [Ilumatobacteraceae bacterium]
MQIDERPPGVDPLVASRRLRRRLVSVQAAAIAGIVCAVAWSLSIGGLLTTPELGADPADIVEHYADPSSGTSALVWLQVMVVGTIAFLWFVGVVRGRLGDNEPKLFGTVFFGASILVAALLFVAAALLAAPGVLVAVGDTAPSPDATQLTRAGADIVMSVFAPRIATLVMFATAGLARATGALPRWLIVLTYVVGVVEFVNVTITPPTIYIVTAWIALVSIVLLVRPPSHGFELAAPVSDAPPPS